MKEEKKEEKKTVKLEEKEEKKLSNKNKKSDGNVPKKTEFKSESKKEKKEKKEDPAVEAIINEGAEEKKDPIPATPIQKKNPNYCTYKVKADGTPHPDACKCIYVKDEDGKCVQLTNDCMPADVPPTDC